VWVIDSATRSATVYRPLDIMQHPSEDDRLDGDPVVPGVSCALRELVAWSPLPMPTDGPAELYARLRRGVPLFKW